MPRAWSKQIEQRYGLRLPPELACWFDEEIWRHPGQAEFHYPLVPEEFLDPSPGVIWAGFMLPDTLPLVGNQYGDWLCLRVAPDGQVSEILCWNHGGGDWIPYGRSLAEALLYDACTPASASFPPSDGDSPDLDVDSPVLRWARQWICSSHEQLRGRLDLPDLPGSVVLDWMLEAGLAEIVIRRDRTLQHLASPLKSGSDPETARTLNVRWDPVFVRWLFDTDLIPLAAREDLGRLFDQPLEQLLEQDWASAEQEALAVTRIRQDLGWPYDITGWAAERRGDTDRAIELYARGVRTSLFADETVRFRTHWFPEGFGKFAAARLAYLRDRAPKSLVEDPYLNLFWQNDAASLRSRLREYWIGKAEQHLARAQYMHAFHCYYHAGWDCGLSDLDGYAEILDGLGTSAAAAGACVLASVVETHRRFLPTQSPESCGSSAN